MSSRRLSYWLIILFAFQAVVAVADIHGLTEPSHEEGVHEHHHKDTDALHEGHNDDESPEQHAQLQQALDALDCGHCCQCHGTSSTFLLSYLAAPEPAPSSFVPRVGLSDHYLSVISEPGLRPPIA